MTRAFARRAFGAVGGASVLFAVTGLGVAGGGTARAASTARSRATISLTRQAGAAISPGLFGANLLWPYGAGGAYDLNAGRFYPGFVSAVRAAGVTVLRYPGGTTADSFVWQRAIGSLAQRRPNEPYGVQNDGAFTRGTVRDGPVASSVGPDEFASLLRAAHAVGSLVVNFTTGSAASAADLVSYLTAPVPGTAVSDRAAPGYWAEKRAANGDLAPAPIGYVEVGNEQQVPAEFGWRAGALVSYGAGAPACPSGDSATCLYAFGGTTRFSDQSVGTFADQLPLATYGTGRPDQTRFVYYPPVVPDSVRVTVDGVAWRKVTRLSAAPAGAHVYALHAATGQIVFGGAGHGAAPPAGARIAATYESGPHDGFVQFYAAIKAVDPAVQVCESEGGDAAFFAVMGRRPYDCVELHEYAAPFSAVADPLTRYEDALMAYPLREARQLAVVRAEIRRAAGRTVPIVLTEYGQAVRPMPLADPAFIMSLDEGLLVADQLRTWIEAGLPLAEKYLLTSSPFLAGDRVAGGDVVLAHLREHEGVVEFDPGLSIGSAMIAGPGPQFLSEPGALVLKLMSSLAGDHLVRTRVSDVGDLPISGAPVLESVAGESATGLSLVVINDSPTTAEPARLDLGGRVHGTTLTVSVLDGSSPTAYNTPGNPAAVTVSTHFRSGAGNTLDWTFPAHSLTLLQWS